MNFKKELAKYGYNLGNSIDVETLIDEILPAIFSEKSNTKRTFKTVKIKDRLPDFDCFKCSF